MIQEPSPGNHVLLFRGDVITFRLTLNSVLKGSAWLRTNIGRTGISRREIIRSVEKDLPLLAKDWFDIPMKKITDCTFSVSVPITEPGNFEGKCFFLKDGDPDPFWPEGDNTVVNVEPSDTCSANIIYNAFVRQFGPNKSGDFKISGTRENFIKELDGEGYSVIPPSGTFRDLIKELDFIIGELGCRVIHLLPVHPTPTTYAKMGRFGSPYASLSFTAVDPSLAEFDPSATPLEQFIELVDAIHYRDSKVILDFAINHTGWAASLHESHPQWLVRDEDGTIENPGAWGVIWGDLTRLDYSHKELWQFMSDIFLTWCKRGVDGFRCDAGYMIPVEAWKYIVCVVREQFPDTIFFLEGLGGKISVTRDILNTANFNWAYSELFQNFDRYQIESYLPQANQMAKQDGIMFHFAETHDNNRLASESNAYAEMRTALCALFSHQGGFGFANGVEWFAKEKINVHDACSLNWNAEPNQVKKIKQLTTILKHHPAFFDKVEIKMLQKGAGDFIVLSREHIPTAKKLLILVNLDKKNSSRASWSIDESGIDAFEFFDMLTGNKITVEKERDDVFYTLKPLSVLCLTPDPGDLKLMEGIYRKDTCLPDNIKSQNARLKVLQIITWYKGISDISDLDMDAAVEGFLKNPVEFCRHHNPHSDESRVTIWNYPQDLNREVMIPPNHFLMVRSENSFRAVIIDKGASGETVLSVEMGNFTHNRSFFALFQPHPEPFLHKRRELKLSVYKKNGSEHVSAPILFLSNAENAFFRKVYKRRDIDPSSFLMLLTNGRGGMSRSHLSWNLLNSKYDGLLAANFNQEYPVDRWIMFSRLRAWIVYQGYSQELTFGCFDMFKFDYEKGGIFRFRVPVGQGEYILFTIGIEMIEGQNAVRMIFFRHRTQMGRGKLEDTKKIQLILRPDIENRSFHETTKAYAGPEEKWAGNITVKEDSFVFSPSADRNLKAHISEGIFVSEPEWYYMIHRKYEKDRGMDADSDLFSPGYFKVFMGGGSSSELIVNCFQGHSGEDLADLKHYNDRERIKRIRDHLAHEDEYSDPGIDIKRSLKNYVVKRGEYKSVIAGYPWFLDWGRDSLIFTRGLISANYIEDSKKVLKQFGRFEKGGTLPNMIAGHDAGNRDTADAILWFFVACSDLTRKEKSQDFLKEDCGGRPIKKVLTDTGEALLKGTENGIFVDEETGLLYSPSHFTWMDTNFPAGTPREGYCIEIQSLWHAALRFLAEIDKSNPKWHELSKKVRQSVMTSFVLETGYLADCIHVKNRGGAKNGTIDDALRPNQLFAITLGLVTDKEICSGILDACESLLIPGAIRSLADKPVKVPIEIFHHGRLLNDPYHPYIGKYEGDEDTKRKPAYHNGTAWTWVFPSFCEAWAILYGDEGKETARSLLSSSFDLMNRGCIGHIPEILDGDSPHTERGCDAQAWGASELFRVWNMLCPAPE